MIRYRIQPISPRSHLFQVELEIANPDSEGQVVTLPAWIPGSYMIRDFAKNITEISAFAGDREVRLRQRDKQTWCAEQVDSPLRIVYQVYSWDLSVRTSHLDQTHGYFNGTSVFLRVVNQDDVRCEVRILPPKGIEGWVVATTMPQVSVDTAGFGRYQAENYESLIDYPVEMGRFALLEYQVESVRHQMAITGQTSCDHDRLIQDLAKICQQHINLFQELPVDRYLFLTMATADGYGGLEHRDCASLICSRDDLPRTGMKEMTEGYLQFLGLCSHEYFHLWNIKRIRPRILQQANLGHEVHTELLWAFEGITSYYDDLALVRAGCISPEDYLGLLAKTITRVMRGSGRFKQSLAQSSFNAWTKFYKQDENAANAIVSYYAKGCLVALGLDVSLRLMTDDAVSLNALMRELWVRYGRPDMGVPEDGIETLVEELVGHSTDAIQEFFQAFIHGTDELPLADWLGEFGVGLRLRPAKDPKDLGGYSKDRKDIPTGPVLGAGYKKTGDFIEITQVSDGGAAQLAGLSAGDRLVAIDGLLVSEKGLKEGIAGSQPGECLEVLAFRRDELMSFNLQPLPAPSDTCDLWLRPDEDLTDKQRRRRQHWLAEIERLH